MRLADIDKLTADMQNTIAAQQSETHEVVSAIGELTVSVNSIAENAEEAHSK